MELEKPWTTELQVRMDCNGCVHKIKKSLHGIEGVYDVHVDFPQQKVTVVGRASPEKMVKAIKKARKIATICSHTENSTDAATEPPPPAADPPPADSEPPPAEAPPAEEPPKEEPPAPPAEEAPPALEEESSPPADQTKEVEEVPMVHHYPHHGDLHHWNNYGMLHHDPHQVPYSQSNYHSSPSAVTIVAYPQSFQYHNHDYYHQQQQQHQLHQNYVRGGSDGNNITSMFSDENPNACVIV